MAYTDVSTTTRRRLRKRAPKPLLLLNQRHRILTKQRKSGVLGVYFGLFYPILGHISTQKAHNPLEAL
jgi:hypothetical protein